MTYRENEPAPEPALGTPSNPHPFGHGRWRCPKCGQVWPISLAVHVTTAGLLRVEHVRPFGSNRGCSWHTETYEQSRRLAAPSPWASPSVELVVLSIVFFSLTVIIFFAGTQ